MTGRQPLIDTADLIKSNLTKNWKDDTWPVVSHLYAGAILQMQVEDPINEIKLDAFETKLIFSEAIRPLMAKGFFREVAQEILNDENPARLSGIARTLVAEFGPPLLGKISFLLSLRPNIATGKEKNDCIAGTIGGIEFRLVPSFYGGGLDHTEEPFKHHLTAHLPLDGWDKHKKILPRYVRVLTGEPARRNRIYYLETINPKANARLASNYDSLGLTFATLPLHPDLVLERQKLRVVTDGELFRLAELEESKWPSDWKDHLWNSLEQCTDNYTSIVILPELMGSPRVREVCKEYIKQCRNPYPILLLAGSWHTDVNGSFYNRLELYSCDGGSGSRRVCSHDKFAPFFSKGYVEGCSWGSGYTYLVTSIGIIGIGICRDWYFEAQIDNGEKAKKQLRELVPTVSLAPSMTPKTSELHHSVSDFFRRERSIFVFANACGPVREMIGGCCTEGQDLRSFIAAPDQWYSIESLCDTSNTLVGNVAAVQAPCHNNSTKDNTVIARVRLRDKDE